MKFLMDTGFLMNVMEFRIDLIAELMKFGRPELCTVDLVVKELQKMSGGRGRKSRWARLSIAFLENMNVKVIASEGGHTDHQILRHALEEDMVVCVVDKRLKIRLKESGATIITIRQRKYLVRDSPRQ